MLEVIVVANACMEYQFPLYYTADTLYICNVIHADTQSHACGQQKLIVDDADNLLEVRTVGKA